MLFEIKNLASNECCEIIPWEVAQLEKTSPGKSSWNDPELDHHFICGVRGGVPQLRVSKNNPATHIHALIADYDADHSAEDLKAVVSKRCKTYAPNYVARTHSGGVRAVWLLEAPLPVTPATAKALLPLVIKKLKPDALFSGFDRDAMCDVYKYYELGYEWVNIHNDLLNKHLVGQWIVLATQKTKAPEGVVVPSDKILDRMQELFPNNKWPGTFEVGARGPRFWDAEADNETAAVVRETGMQCWTGNQSFIPWKQLLGAKWVAQFEAEKVGSVSSNVFFDGKFYWTEGTNGWRAMDRTDVRTYLKVRCGLSGRPDDTGASEVDRALVMIQDIQTVDKVVAVPATPTGCLNQGGQRVLNTLKRYPIQPEAGSCGYIERYLNGLMVNNEQLTYLLCWIKHAYSTALKMDMKPGQTLFLVGETQTGKTLFNTVLLSDLLGGSMDASSYLTGETTWNGPLFENPLWTVDDVTCLTSAGATRRWNTMLKKMAANQSFTVSAKYRQDVTVRWNGRVCVTLNNDPQSLGVLPDLDISNQDKVMVLKCSDKKQKFDNDAAEKIRAELPAFAAWLLEWEPPEEYLAHDRFWVKSFLDTTLESEARQNSIAHSLMELLITYMENSGETELKGSSTDILAQLADEGSPVQSIVRSVTAVALGKQLGTLSAKFPDLVTRQRSTHSRIWTINEGIMKAR
jgi:hypothetical protein